LPELLKIVVTVSQMIKKTPKRLSKALLGRRSRDATVARELEAVWKISIENRLKLQRQMEVEAGAVRQDSVTV
jgi:hypothetical protein